MSGEDTKEAEPSWTPERPVHLDDPMMRTMSKAESREAELELREKLAALRRKHQAAAGAEEEKRETRVDSINVEEASPK